MTTFYFVRHARKAEGVGDVAISPEGSAQARATAAHLKAQPIAAVYSSPLLRALETAAPIAAAHGLPVIADVRLRERMNFGDVAGQSREEFCALWQRGTRERDFVPPVGDSSRGAGQRVEAFIRDIAAQQPHAHIVAVTHGGVLADFLRNVFTPAQLAAAHPAFAADQYDGSVMRECAITLVRYAGAQYVLDDIASAQHLEEMAHG